MNTHNPLRTVEMMTEAFQNSDVDAVMRTYESSAAVCFEPGVVCEDHSVIREMFTQMAQLRPQFSYAGHEVIAVGDLAVHIAPWKMAATAPDGSHIEDQGLSVAVLRRQANGEWRMVIDNPHGGRLVS